MKSKQELLDKIERQALLVAGEIALGRVVYPPRMAIIENCLGEILAATHDLKKIEGVCAMCKENESPKR